MQETLLQARDLRQMELPDAELESCLVKVELICISQQGGSVLSQEFSNSCACVYT